MGVGMWVALDTISEERTEISNRLIATKWGQANPWCIYTPYKNNNHCLVGCVGVAVAQYLYYYRKNNHAGYELPTVATFENTSNSTPVFSNFSESAWNGMAHKSTDVGTDKSAMFMSYLGKQLDLDYGLYATGGYVYDTELVLNHYNIIRSESYNYDGESVLYSLENNDPVLIAGYTTSFEGHMFIIDGYQKQIDRTYASFVWDSDYKYTQEDIIKYEGWRFSENIDFKDEKGEYAEKELYVNNNTYIAMNWGWDGYGDDTYYLASRCCNTNSEETYIAPYWSVAGSIFNNISYISYNAYAR